MLSRGSGFALFRAHPGAARRHIPVPAVGQGILPMPLSGPIQDARGATQVAVRQHGRAVRGCVESPCADTGGQNNASVGDELWLRRFR
jgi:hypothetical protein